MNYTSILNTINSDNPYHFEDQNASEALNRKLDAEIAIQGWKYPEKVRVLLTNEYGTVGKFLTKRNAIFNLLWQEEKANNDIATSYKPNYIYAIETYNKDFSKVISIEFFQHRFLTDAELKSAIANAPATQIFHVASR